MDRSRPPFLSRYQFLTATFLRAKGRPGLTTFGTHTTREEMQNAKDSAQDLSKLSIEDNFGHRFFIAPHRHTKTFYLVRHGEGYHNLAGAERNEPRPTFRATSSG